MLGEGSFGKVYKQGNYAIKEFKKTNHMIQETIATKYMRDSQYIVNIKEFNLEKRSFTMDIYKTSLRHYANTNKVSFEDKKKIFKDVLKALCDIHSRGLVHADVKPSNILLDFNPLRAILCDLGLTSIERFARTTHTAPAYRLPNTNITGSPLHDLFAAAVTFSELFAEKEIENTEMISYVTTFINKNIDQQDLKNVLLLMCETSTEKSITARIALKMLFGEDQSLTIPVFISEFETPPPNYKTAIYTTVKQISKSCNINRGRLAVEVIIERLFNPNYPHVSPTEYELYVVCMMIIFSSCFGESGYSVDSALYSTGGKWRSGDIYRVLYDYFSKDHIIDMIMLPEY